MAKDFKTKEISGTRSVAEKLKTARKKKKIGLEDAERDTNIRLKYLEAFETSRYDVLPSEVYALGFLRRYAEYLGLNIEEMSELYKMEWQAYIRRGGQERTNDFSPPKVRGQTKFIITPKTIAIVTVTLIIIGLFGYIWWAVKNFSTPPKLILIEPKAETVITGDIVTVRGLTDVGAFVIINNVPVNVGPDGEFNAEVNVGTNVTVIEIVAKNRLNSRTVHTIKIVNETKEIIK